MSGGVRVILAGLLLATVGGCVGADEDSWLLLSARSDNGQIARLWCPNLCDVDEDIALTISSAERTLSLRRDVDGFPAAGEMPTADIVWQGHRQLIDGRSRLRWRDGTVVEVTLPCVTGEARGRRWKVAMVDSARPGTCRS